MNECMHFLRCECIWCKHESEKLNTKDFQQGQLPLIQKVIGDLFSKWTYDLDKWSQAWSKKKAYKSSWLILMSVLPFSISVVGPPHASPFLGVHLRFRFWPLCFPLSVVIYSFCSLSIRSRFRTKSWKWGPERCQFMWSISTSFENSSV